MNPTHRHASLQGIGFAVLATACFATLDTTTRHVSAGLSVLVALWFRYVIQALITTIVVWPGRGRQVLRTRNPRFQLAGSHEFDWTLALPLLLVLANAGFQILTSHMSKTEDPITTLLHRLDRLEPPA